MKLGFRSSPKPPSSTPADHGAVGDQHRRRCLLALVQTDIKKVIAYSSISHLGYVMLGWSASTSSASGAVIQW